MAIGFYRRNLIWLVSFTIKQTRQTDRQTESPWLGVDDPARDYSKEREMDGVMVNIVGACCVLWTAHLQREFSCGQSREQFVESSWKSS